MKDFETGLSFFSISYNILRGKKRQLKLKEKVRIEYLTQVLNSKVFEAYF